MLEILVAPKPMPAITLYGTGTAPLNLANDRLGRAFTIPGAGTRTLVVDLGASYDLNTFALLAHNMPTTATWRVRTGTLANLYPVGGVAGAAPTGAVTFDSGSQGAWASPEAVNRVHRSAIHHAAAVVNSRYVRIDIDAMQAAAIGRLVIGKAFEPLEARDYGWESRVIDLGKLERSATGLDDVLFGGKVHQFNWTWSGLGRDEAENVSLELMIYAGTTRDVLVCLDYDAANRHNLIGYGKLTEPSVTANYAEDWYEMSVELLSRLVLAL